MGTLSWGTSTLATFENGIVYNGFGFYREQIGSYDSECIYDNQGHTVARIKYNSAMNPQWLSTESYCTCDDSKVYEGGSTWNSTLAVYDGDSSGALAATVLHFRLYKEADKSVNNNLTVIDPGQGNIVKNEESESGFSLIGIIILVIIACMIGFFFTDWGHQMMFQEAGFNFLFLTFCSSLITAFFAIKGKKKPFIEELIQVAIALYIIDYILLQITAFYDGYNKGMLNFGSAVMMLIGGLIPVLGIAAPFCLLVAVISYIVKSKRKK